MTRKGKLALFGCLIVLVGAAVAGKAAHEISQYSISRLLVCYDTNPAPIAWTCKQVLTQKLKSPEIVLELNKTGSVLFPLLMTNEESGREMLKLLVSNGVDINAVDSGVRIGWTALHIVAMDTILWPVEALLDAGADRNAKDAEGMTPLDRAREVQAKHPHPGRASIIAQLEAQTGSR